MVCLYCYGRVLHIAYLYKVVQCSSILGSTLYSALEGISSNNLNINSAFACSGERFGIMHHFVFKFQLRAHANLTIPLGLVDCNYKVIFLACLLPTLYTRDGHADAAMTDLFWMMCICGYVDACRQTKSDVGQ